MNFELCCCCIAVRVCVVCAMCVCVCYFPTDYKCAAEKSARHNVPCVVRNRK